MSGTRWRVYRGPLSGRIYAARMRYDDRTGTWKVVGSTKHDVSEDVWAIIRDLNEDVAVNRERTP